MEDPQVGANWSPSGASLQGKQEAVQFLTRREATQHGPLNPLNIPSTHTPLPQRCVLGVVGMSRRMARRGKATRHQKNQWHVRTRVHAAEMRRSGAATNLLNLGLHPLSVSCSHPGKRGQGAKCGWVWWEEPVAAATPQARTL